METQTYEAAPLAAVLKAEASQEVPVDLLSPQKQSESQCEAAPLNPAETVENEHGLNPELKDADGRGPPAETKDGDGLSPKCKDEAGHVQPAESKKGNVSLEGSDRDGLLAKMEGPDVSGQASESEQDCSHLARCMVERT